MKDKTFYILLIATLSLCLIATASFVTYGIHLWKSISIVEMVANWG